MNSALNGNIPHRPRIADASVNTLLWAIAGGLIRVPRGAIVGGPTGNALANQPQPLEMAIWEFLSPRNFELAFFYPGPRGVKITIQKSQTFSFWTLESKLPDQKHFASEEAADWLYHDLIHNKLTPLMIRIQELDET